MTAAPSALIELKQIGKTYGSGGNRVDALMGVDLAFAPGSYNAIIGPSGSGKSTMMNLIGLLDRPSSGQHLFRGVDITRTSNQQRAILRRAYLGFVFQGFNLMSRSSAVENVELPLIYQRKGARERRAMALEALDHVGLADRANHRPSQLSGGQQQRVAIARAIVSHPDVILADEPTGALDTKTGTQVLDLIEQLNQDMGLTIIMVTHDPNVAARARRTVAFLDGRIQSDTPNERA